MLSFNSDVNSSAFEVNIRLIGGLMSAHHLTGDALFLGRAQELTDKLMVIFEGEEAKRTGIPVNWVNFAKGEAYMLRHHDQNASKKDKRAPPPMVLAEFGTFQMELGAVAEVISAQLGPCSTSGARVFLFGCPFSAPKRHRASFSPSLPPPSLSVPR